MSDRERQIQREPNQKPLGRHPHQRLTAVAVTAKKTAGRYADGNGLYLVVDPSGAKRWIWRGVVQGKRSELGLGGISYVSLATARERAAQCRREARDGKSPRTERQRAQRIVPTFETAARRVHAEHSDAFRNPKHRAQWLASLENDVFPVIGGRLVTAIDSGDVLKVLTPIWTVKPETARRLKQRMKVVFDWAKASGLRSGDNPTDGLTKVLPKHRGDKQHHAALPYQAVPAFLTALHALPDLRVAVRDGLELLILTASRTNEVQLATWPEIDLAGAVWTIPGSRMKSGREHRIPLSPRAVEVLQRAHSRATDDTPFVFPGNKPGKPLSNMTFLKAARRVTATTLTTHGFRSSFRDWSAERTHIPTIVCEAALAHVVRDKTEAAYRRRDLFAWRRELMTLWAHFATGATVDVIATRA